MKPSYSDANSYTMPSSMRQQQGVALIVVLMVVLLLALVGAMAVRSAQTSLNMSTAAQVSQLLFQSSDVPLANLQNLDNAQIQSMNTLSGPIGYLRTNGDKFKGAEYVLCYQPTSRDTLYAGPNQHRVVASADGNTVLQDTNGYCDLTQNNVYTSQRGVVATQLSMTRPTVNDTLIDDVNVHTDLATQQTTRTHTSQPFQVTLGTDLNSVASNDDMYVRTYATSVLPSLAISSKVTDIAKCMQLPIGGLATDTPLTSQLECLKATDTPNNVQVQDFMYIKDVQVAPPAAAPPPASSPSGP